MTDQMTVYTTPWCGFCHRLKRELDQVGIAYQEVDIAADPGAARIVADINHGNQTVPTVVLPNGTALRNPSLAEIRSGLTVN